jgi:hypothetical protein
VLVTHWGLSGPAVLKLSAWGARFLSDRHYQANLLINWLPQYSLEELREQLQLQRGKEKKAIANSCPFPLPRRLWESLLRAAAIDSHQRWAELSNKSLNKLVGELARGEYEIKGKGVFKEEFVTCGGVSLKEVNFKTMESRLCPGLYLAGEVLALDGVTGGFNFQSAWTTDGWPDGLLRLPENSPKGTCAKLIRHTEQTFRSVLRDYGKHILIPGDSLFFY